MKNGIRTIQYDESLRIEAYHFEGVAQSFPNHFHAHYAIGLVERGRHVLSCKNQTYVLGPGSVVVFNPGDNHACIQDAGGDFDYRGLNIEPEGLCIWTPEGTCEKGPPRFSKNVTDDAETACHLQALHELILNGAPTLQKEERLFLLLAALGQSCGQTAPETLPDHRQEIEVVCAFIRAKGVTPYRYLENVRVEQARALLRKGVPPLETALRTGFSDQSHFTNYFSSVTGLTPGAYRDTFAGSVGRDSRGGACARKVSAGRACPKSSAAQGGVKA